MQGDILAGDLILRGSGDPRLTLEAKREVKFYAEQSEALATFTGGSGAVAVLLTDGSFEGAPGPRLPSPPLLHRWPL